MIRVWIFVYKPPECAPEAMVQRFTIKARAEAFRNYLLVRQYPHQEKSVDFFEGDHA